MAALGNLKLFSFVLLFPLTSLLLFEDCISWCSKLPLWSYFDELSPMYPVQSPLINCFSLLICFSALRAPRWKPKMGWGQVLPLHASCQLISVSCYLACFLLFCHTRVFLSKNDILSLFKVSVTVTKHGNGLEIYSQNECLISKRIGRLVDSRQGFGSCDHDGWREAGITLSERTNYVDWFIPQTTFPVLVYEWQIFLSFLFYVCV